jgi:transcriptional regulator with GAF, ATPase, and Fis domain
VRGSDEPEPEGARDDLRLVVVHSPDDAAVGAVARLSPGDVLLLGRDISEGLRIRDARMSRLHLRIVWDPVQRGFRYGDAGSANGTFVGGARAESGLLLPDTVLRVGDSLLVCVGEDHGATLRTRALGAARSTLPVLIRGETGSGKELVARTIHDESRRPGSFVAVNCAALPIELAATELFGHTRGAFSGAGVARPGLFRAADGGSLLLDEIGDLPFGLQGHLLRTLQERTVRPVGADREVPVDVRVLAATHVDLEDAVRSGRFREDLLSRLAQLLLDVPPLRSRRSQILSLALGFAPGLTLTAGAAEALLIGDWPGNVRELKALIESHVPSGEPERTLRARDLADRLTSAELVLNRDAAAEKPAEATTALERRRQLAELLRKHDGNISEVARELGKPRAQIYRWLRAFGLSKRGGA